MRVEHQVEPSVSASGNTAPPSLRSGATRIAASQIVRRGCRMLALLVAARVLGPSQFGLYTVLLTVSEIVAIFSGTGYADYLTREVARDTSSKHLTIRLAVLRAAYLSAGVACATALLWVLGFSKPAITGTAFMGLALLPRTVNELGQGIVRGHQRFGRLIVIEALQGAALLIGVTVFLIRGAGIRGLIIVEIVAALVGAVAAVVISLGLAGESRKVSNDWRELIRNTFAFNLYPLIVNVYDRADVLLLSRLASDAAVGIYGLPYRIFSTLQIIPYGLMSALLPRLSGARWSPDSEKLISAVLRRTFAAALLLILAVMLLASPAARLLLGARYAGADVVLKILIWAVPLVFINSIFNTILLAMNRERVFLLTATVCTVINISANVIVIPIYSYRGAAAVTVFTELALVAQNLWFIRKAVGYIPAPTNIGALMSPFVVTCAAGVALQHYLPEWPIGLALVTGFAVFLLKRGELPILFRRTAGVSAGADA